MPKEKLLTEVELEMMNAVWNLGTGTVNEVREELGPTRQLAYTSVATILRILESKGFLSAKKEGRGHRYSPTLEREAYERTSVSHLVDKVFKGTPSALAKHLIQKGKFSKDELSELHSLLESKLS